MRKKLPNLQRQQADYDRRIAAYQLSGKKGSTLQEEKQAEERARLRIILPREKDIEQAESSKSRLADETDQMVVGERQRREDERKDYRK